MLDLDKKMVEKRMIERMMMVEKRMMMVEKRMMGLMGVMGLMRFENYFV